MSRYLFTLLSILCCGLATADNPLWIQYDGGQGAGSGKRVVFVSGDEEYRSEEGLPQLAKIGPSVMASSARCCSPSILRPVKSIR